MSQKDQEIENAIVAAGANVAPRLTPTDIDAKIKHVEYILPRDVCKRDNGVETFDAPVALQTLTFCVLTLENGFTVTGESACASPENFDPEIGKKVARENAREKIWLLEGYLLKQRLHEQPAGIEKLLETRIPILDQIYDLCQAIEKCGASPELTDAVRKAGALRYPISELVQQATALGIGAGIVGVSHSNEAKVCESLSFSEALSALKDGYRVARTGWNAANQWLSVSNLNTADVPADRFWSPHNREYAEQNGGTAQVPPCITIKNAQGQVQMGWVPSQGDLFANDWVILEEQAAT